MLRPYILFALLALPLAAAAQSAPTANDSLRPGRMDRGRMDRGRMDRARQPLPAADRATRMTQHMEQQAGPFTDEQRARIYVINLRTAQDLDSHRADLRTERSAMRKAHLDRENEIAALLTPDQRQRYDAARAQRQAQWQDRREERNQMKTNDRRGQPIAPADSSRH